MPRKVPTRAAATLRPISSGGPPIALIVQYVVKNNDDDAKPAAANPEKKPRENSDGPTENSAKKQ